MGIESLHDRLTDEYSEDGGAFPIATIVLIAALFVGLWLIGASFHAGISGQGGIGR